MNKRISTFVILILITAGSVCALSIHHNDVRSDLNALTPYSIMSSDTTGSLVIGDESYQFISSDVLFGVDLIQDNRSHCWITAIFSKSSFGTRNYLEFDYWTMENSQAPVDSIRIYKSGNESKYLYEDPLTSTRMTFYLVNDIVNKISFKGTAINEFDGELKFVSFDIDASFDMGATYVNRIFRASLPESRILDIAGEENGTAKSGTLSIDPISSIIWEDGRIRTTSTVSVTIDGTSIPDSLLTVITEIRDDYGFTGKNLRIQYLDHDGKYVDQNVVFKMTGGDDPTLILEGKITTSVLDSDCRITEQTSLEFRYEAV